MPLAFQQGTRFLEDLFRRFVLCLDTDFGRNPGFKEQNELLYDTGSSKKHSKDSAETTTGTAGSAGQLGSSTTTSDTTGLTGSHQSDLTHHDTQQQSHTLDSTTSRTASNQKDHMDPQDFAAARVAGTSHETSAHNQQNTQPAFGSATGAGDANYAQQEPHQFQSTTQQGVTQPQGQQQSNNPALAGGLAGAAIGTHEKHGRNVLRKENPNAPTATSHQTTSSHEHGHHHSGNAAAGHATGSHQHAHHAESNVAEHPTASSEQHGHHTGRDAALGAGAVGAAGVAHHEHSKKDEHEEPKKERSILNKILHPSSSKHDHETTTTTAAHHSHTAGSGSHQLHSDHGAIDSRAPTNEPAANASIGGAQAIAPVGAGAVGAVFAAHEEKKHHEHHQGLSSGATSIPNTTGVTHHQPTSQQHSVVPNTEHRTQAHQPLSAGSATGPLGVGAIGAIAGAHEEKKHHNEALQSQQGQSQGSLTHHQHNTGGLLSHHETSGHQHQHSQHSHSDVAGATESSHDHHHQHHLTGHEQRDLHEHSSNDTGLSHHVHNGVTAMPNHHNHSRADETTARQVDVGHHHVAAGSGVGAGTATAGIAAASTGHHNSTNLENTPQTTDSSDSGPASKTMGPHKSNILNILDPRVKPDMQALKENKEAKKAEKGTENQPESLSGSHHTEATSLAERPKTETYTPTGSGNQGTTGHAFETSGAAGTHSNPAHTDDLKGIVTGERGNVGDPSNVYSKKPLDERVTMPGSFPDSSMNVNKTT
jgi:hypothetical protein